MPVAHFNVTQIRIAASCPRILYFDAEEMRTKGLKRPRTTRIWKLADEVQTSTACGSLFHGAVERFNRNACKDAAVPHILLNAGSPEAMAADLLRHIYGHYLNKEALFGKTGQQQQAFLAALGRYTGELADILFYARTLGKKPEEILDQVFGDARKTVDVTFRVGPAEQPVRITGSLDYFFYDWRIQRHRVLDYKLTPAQMPANDLFQVATYALMHDRQHNTRPEVGVLYLHPSRQMFGMSWEQVDAERHKVYSLLASMRAWVDYDEKTGVGVKPPGEPLFCEACRWKKQCEARLGPTHQGTRLSVAS